MIAAALLSGCAACRVQPEAAPSWVSEAWERRPEAIRPENWRLALRCRLP